MSSSNRHLSLPLLFVAGLAGIAIIGLILILRLLTAVQAENRILRQQIAIAELQIQSLQNQREAEQILHAYETKSRVTPSSDNVMPSE